MKIIGLSKLQLYCDTHPDIRKWIENWLCDVRNSSWATPQDIKNVYPSASFLSDRKVIFNVKGNHYRLLVQVAFNTQIVAVLWIGNHSEYSKQLGN